MGGASSNCARLWRRGRGRAAPARPSTASKDFRVAGRSAGGDFRGAAGSAACCRRLHIPPEADDGKGMARWTPDPAQALTFATAEDAVACYRAVPSNRPLRPDGKPNRPLTMFAVMFD